MGPGQRNIVYIILVYIVYQNIKSESKVYQIFWVLPSKFYAKRLNAIKWERAPAKNYSGGPLKPESFWL